MQERGSHLAFFCFCFIGILQFMCFFAIIVHVEVDIFSQLFVIDNTFYIQGGQRQKDYYR